VGANPGDGGQMFAKTGTTDKADQIWLIGSNTALTTVTWMGNIEGDTSLRQIYGPHGQYAGSRASLFNSIQTVNDTLYKGGDFVDPPQSMITGSGITVPSLTGQTADQARATLQGLGLTYVDGGTQASALTQGQVSATSPTAGGTVSRGGSVTVYTSDGSQAASVPNVTGQQLGDALSALQSAGFDTSKVQIGYTKTDDGQKCAVQAANPAGGSTAAKDTAIQLTVGGGQAGTDPGTCS
jgi:membrane peptidoglycan carboxypeptidase